jgi:hypothetical protein
MTGIGYFLPPAAPAKYDEFYPEIGYLPLTEHFFEHRSLSRNATTRGLDFVLDQSIANQH